MLGRCGIYKLAILLVDAAAHGSIGQSTSLRARLRVVTNHTNVIQEEEQKTRKKKTGIPVRGGR
jgi:hypothetical protein